MRVRRKLFLILTGTQVDTTVVCGTYNGDDHVTLNFANVKMKQKIHVKKMRLEVQERFVRMRMKLYVVANKRDRQKEYI